MRGSYVRPNPLYSRDILERRRYQLYCVPRGLPVHVNRRNDQLHVRDVQPVLLGNLRDLRPRHGVSLHQRQPDPLPRWNLLDGREDELRILLERHVRERHRVDVLHALPRGPRVRGPGRWARVVRGKLQERERDDELRTVRGRDHERERGDDLRAVRIGELLYTRTR